MYHVYLKGEDYVNCETGELYFAWEIDDLPNVFIHNSFDAYLGYTQPYGYGAMDLLAIEVAMGRKGLQPTGAGVLTGQAQPPLDPTTERIG